ncbi:PREDICTED: coiled-coil-helix-coiled-coil-helix domain-containing protein 1 [Polistes dominula]|uniref:Coiled-coil-helix-coiled-coil-helix domain-containing protein 1 n=1 Tax=Polistes dominula TaxID=743375 RepID=A0ABM1J5R7_POLDO|nr:PREDICTED: coiled-coil-helix-coiled-coil-helix domain-containing protein 1 [Polistes dominula]
MRVSLAYFKGRLPQNEAKVPFKVADELALKDYVSCRSVGLAEKGCLHELSILLTCLRENEFDNFNCSKELTSFENCSKRFAKLSSELKASHAKSVPDPNSKVFSSKQINYLLKLYAKK